MCSKKTRFSQIRDIDRKFDKRGLRERQGENQTTRCKFFIIICQPENDMHGPGLGCFIISL